MESAGREGGARRWKGEGEGLRGMKMFRTGVLGRSWITGSGWFCCAGLMEIFLRQGVKRTFLCWMMRLVFFPGIDPEVMLMSVLFYARLLRFEKGLGWFLCAVVGGQERELWGCR